MHNLLKKNVPRVNEDNMTQVSEEKQNRLKKMSRRFSVTESRTYCALLELDQFHLHPNVQVPFGSAPETSRNYDRENHGCFEDRSQTDLHPEVGTSVKMSPHSMNSDPNQIYHSLYL